MSTRRHFFKQANCAAIGTSSIASTLFSLRMTAGAAAGGVPSGYKALVCLFLNGGNDSFNMLYPREATKYADYATVRGNLTLANGTADPASTGISSTGQSYSEFNIHPNLPFLKKLYEGTYTHPVGAPPRTAEQDLAFIANVGTLVQPTSITDYNNGTVMTPVGLFSHPDERVHWQTMVPQVRGAAPKGWGGRMADCMTQANLSGSVGMNISLSGKNVLQVGNASVPYITSHNGVTLLDDYNDTTLKAAVDSILGEDYGNLYRKTFASNNRNAIDTAESFDAAVGTKTTTETFPSTQVGDRLEMVSKILASRGSSDLNMNRQVFFVERGGWDHHTEVINAQEELFTEVNDAIEAFWNELAHLGLQDDVVLFTGSDFGRTLTSNGAGSDHAWGGNSFMLGGAVNGGKIYGSYPDLYTGNSLDVGRGRLLPTTPVDEYYTELASWFGVLPEEINTVFPNAINFFDPQATPYPLGILGT